MPKYNFEVLNRDEVVFAESSVFLDDVQAAWPKVKSLASRVATPGCRIRVREASGQTIILIGAVAALHYPKYGLVE